MKILAIGKKNIAYEKADKTKAQKKATPEVIKYATDNNAIGKLVKVDWEKGVMVKMSIYTPKAKSSYSGKSGNDGYNVPPTRVALQGASAIVAQAKFVDVTNWEAIFKRAIKIGYDELVAREGNATQGKTKTAEKEEDLLGQKQEPEEDLLGNGVTEKVLGDEPQVIE